MATGLQRLVRRAVLTRLKADSALTALVPAASIYPQAAGQPTWPFIKLGPTGTLKLRAACVRGGLVSVDIHAFARARIVGGVTLETAEDHAGRIGEQIERLLDGVNIALEGEPSAIPKAKIELGDIRLMQDSEPDAFHWFAQINARVLAA